MRDDSGREISLKNGEKLFANPGAQALRVAIRGVLAPDLIFRVEIIAQILAVGREQRTDNRSRCWINARKAGGSRSADQMGQNRFRLVLRGVCHGNARCLAGGADALEKCIAQAPRCIFQIPSMTSGFGGNVLAGSDNFQAAITSQVCNELRIGCGSFTAKQVVKMYDRESYAEVVAKGLKNAKQRH